eukprot:5821505-Alexandrium_andersonii.AAC.1
MFSRVPACDDCSKAALTIMGEGHLNSPPRRKLQIVAPNEPAKAEHLNEVSGPVEETPGRALAEAQMPRQPWWPTLKTANRVYKQQPKALAHLQRRGWRTPAPASARTGRQATLA